ncbi:ATP-binding cassette domain-containing protein [Streptomyces scopuliridis]|uniref:ATP-binding cassette domain-containing protein n=1 Tax=Streptomyces scopuliridis TaxID=452529 RepID=UPI0036C32F84
MELRGGTELRGVGFRYGPGAPQVLENIGFRVTPGSKLAIVGSTGSGKTTLSRLLTGLLRPTVGTVLVDGRPLDDYDHEALRQLFGVVTQFPYTFGGSIRENLTLGRPGVSDDELREALGKARSGRVCLPGRRAAARRNSPGRAVRCSAPQAPRWRAR